MRVMKLGQCSLKEKFSQYSENGIIEYSQAGANKAGLGSESEPPAPSIRGKLHKMALTQN